MNQNITSGHVWACPSTLVAVVLTGSLSGRSLHLQVLACKQKNCFQCSHNLQVRMEEAPSNNDCEEACDLPKSASLSSCRFSLSTVGQVLFSADSMHPKGSRAAACGAPTPFRTKALLCSPALKTLNTSWSVGNALSVSHGQVHLLLGFCS